MIPLPWFLLSRRSADLAAWRSRTVSVDPGSAQRLPHVRYSGEAHGGADGYPALREAILRYRFFPAGRMTGTVDAPDGRIRPGVTIHQRVRVAIAGFDSATRVVALDDRDGSPGTRAISFSYVTLAGHPEVGLATFLAEERADGTIALTIDTWSAPAAWWARLSGPITRRIQVATNRSVIARMTAIAEGRDRPS